MDENNLSWKRERKKQPKRTIGLPAGDGGDSAPHAHMIKVTLARCPLQNLHAFTLLHGEFAVVDGLVVLGHCGPVALSSSKEGWLKTIYNKVVFLFCKWRRKIPTKQIQGGLEIQAIRFFATENTFKEVFSNFHFADSYLSHPGDYKKPNEGFFDCQPPPPDWLKSENKVAQNA